MLETPVHSPVQTATPTLLGSETSAAHVDYDLHGLAGVRLVDASPTDVKTVDRQLGPIRASLAREPDIQIRFVDRIRTSSPVRYLGLPDAAFTEDTFVVMRGAHGSRSVAEIPVHRIGQPGFEIVCESGASSVPLLIPILNLTVLGNGALPLHASAFEYGGVGVLATGWSKGGKTETLLAFMAQGATYVGDEWIYVAADGRTMHGIPQPIRVWDWHLRYLPRYRATLGRRARTRLRVLRAVDDVLGAVRRGVRGGSAITRTLDRARPLLKRQIGLDVSPGRMFDGRFGSLSSTLDRLFFVVSHEPESIAVERVDPQEVARRMVFSLQYERLDFMSYYHRWRFAFPDAANDLVERAEELQREMLCRMLANKEAYAVYHPYPVSIPALFDAIRPYVDP
jgi:hypothetical protein